MRIDSISPVIVGGQGTYKEGRYFTEHPDRDLSVAHAASVQKIVEMHKFTHVVVSGGCTQDPTPTLSEAISFELMWEETGSRPLVRIIYDEIALDSAENLLFGLMALRIAEPGRPIRRVGYYSQWQFKKQRMVLAAKLLGILERFYFYAFASADLANAGALARAGEETQLKELAVNEDYLLLGDKWEKKRRDRYHGPSYNNRTDELKQAFPLTFAAIEGVRVIPLAEFVANAEMHGTTNAVEAMQKERKHRLAILHSAFDREVLLTK